MSDVSIVFIQPDGAEKAVAVAEGITIMEAALFNGVDGIQGLCGGNCSCATCHVSFDDAVYAALPAPGEDEAELVEMLDDRVATSRLGCQVHVSAALSDVRITVMGSDG